jgi:tetratricopeptide (TPR) repeat protein
MKARFTPEAITLKEVPTTGLMALVGEDLVFLDHEGHAWTARVGTLTDGASVPRAALPVTDGRFDQRFLKAAVVHDAYCQAENEGGPSYQTKPWRAVHKMFLDACLAGGTPKTLAKLMYNAVLWFGPRWEDPDKALERITQADRRAGFAASKRWIEETDPSAEAIEDDVAHREDIIIAVTRLQFAGIEALRRNDRATAEKAFQEAEARVTKGIGEAPDDLMYLNLKGYNFKNRAMLSPEKAPEALADAERAFHAVLAVEPEDPSAWNGLGSVAILRGDLDGAEEYIHKALRILPDYPAARHDLRIIEAQRHGPPRD